MPQLEQLPYLVSIIIPVYNTGNLLMETLDSVGKQTLDRELMEIIIVDDASTDPKTLEMLGRIKKEQAWDGIALTVIHHAENRWLAETRNTGVKASRGRYLCCLDSDDLIKPDYLKKAVLSLESHEKAGWAYPGVRKFGYINSLDPAPEFNAQSFFWNNYCVASSLIKREMWELLEGQRTKKITDTVKWFEDWDFWVRAMSKGFYGVPLKEILFLYRQHLKSLIIRSPAVFLATYYVMYRSNFLRLFAVKKAQRNFADDREKGTTKKRNPFLPTTYLDRFAGALLKISMKRREKYYSFWLFCLSIFVPKRFITEILHKKQVLTKAEFLCGFREKMDLDIKPAPHSKKESQDTILFAHFWWKLGGGENVLLEWMKAARELGNIKVLDVVDRAEGDQAFLESQFEAACDEQFAVSRLSTNPLSSLRICWNLVCRERPKVIYIMSNPFFYALAPLIKQYFPDTKIIDLLHCEDNNDPGWFAISDEYKDYLDRRVVTSDFWKKVLVEKYGEQAKKIAVGANSIDLTRFDPAKYNRRELLKNFKIDPEKTVIGFIGRFDYQKNPATFLELAELMLDERQYEFIMVGKGSLDQEIKERLKTLPNVKYLGYTKRPAQYYALCDLIVFPSVYEGYPMVGIEAAAMNVPVIATDIVGFREQIQTGDFGFLYEQEEPKKDAVTIRQILYDRFDELKTRGKKGRSFVQQYHDIEQQKKIYQEILSSLLQ